MQSLAKKIKLLIEADAKQLDRELGRVDSAFNSLKKAAGALGVAVSVGAFARMVKGSLEAVDALSKTADKLGLTTEALASMRHAAEMTGVASNTLDMALQRMTRRLAEAAQGTGEAKGALEELNLDAVELARLSPDQAFAEIAEAMKDVDSQSDRVRLAFKLFDSEGVSLVNTLSLGRDGLKGLRDEAERLGIAMDRETARKAEEAMDSIKRLETAARGAGQQIAIGLAPAISDFADTLTDTEFQDGLRAIVTLLGDVSKFAASAARNIGELEGKFGVIEMYARNTPGLREVLLYQDIKDYTDRKNLPSSVTIPAPKSPASSSGVSEASTSGKIEMVYNGAGKLVPTADREAKFRALDAEGRMMSQGMSDYADQVESDALVKLQGVADRAKAYHVDLAETVGDTTDDMSVYWDEAMRNIQDASADFFYDALQGNINSLEDFAASVKSILDRMVANWLAAQMQMQLTQLFSSAAGLFSMGGQAALGAYSSSIVGTPATFTTGAGMGPGLAAGGPVFPGTVYPVGERGPELFVPQTAGQIVPNSQVGSGVNVQMTVVTPDAKSFESPRAQQQILASYSAALQHAHRRNN